MPLFLQQSVGEGDVLGGNRLAVVKARFWPQVEYDPAAVVGKLQAFGNQAVGRVRLVTGGVVDAAAHHQRLVQLADAKLAKVAGVDRAGALEGVRVERVEGAAAHDPQGTALGRVRVDVVQMLEVGGVLGLAVERVTMLAVEGRPGGLGEGKQQRQAQHSRQQGHDFSHDKVADG